MNNDENEAYVEKWLDTRKTSESMTARKTQADSRKTREKIINRRCV